MAVRFGVVRSKMKLSPTKRNGSIEIFSLLERSGHVHVGVGEPRSVSDGLAELHHGGVNPSDFEEGQAE